MYLGSAFVAGGFLKAGQFKDLSPAMQEGYAIGLLNGLFVSTFLGANEDGLKALSVCIKEMDPGQIAEIISKYVREHPEAWHQD